jgi:uncharacterized RDD family membrane protein YckC
VQYEDRLTIATPEGVTLELTLAGLGSRFVGALIDGLVLAVTYLGILLLSYLLSLVLGEDSPVIFAVLAVLVFLLIFGYDVCFEVFNSGRTVGKLAAGLRVVRIDGGPVNFRTSFVRNVLRLVDWLPGVPVVGIISILATRRNQRVGDLVAGTLVVREPRVPRKARTPAPAAVAAGAGAEKMRAGRAPDLAPQVPTAGPPYSGPSPSPYTGGRPAEPYATPPPPSASGDDLWSWDVSAVTVGELATVRRFLERRGSLDVAARRRLAGQLVERLAPKVAGAPQDLPEEAFLERLARAKAARS